MNITYPPIQIANIPPDFERTGHEVIKAAAFLLIPAELLYFSIYFHTKGLYKLYESLTFLSLGAFWISPVLAPISCSPARCLQNFASMLSPHLLDTRSMLTPNSCYWDPQTFGYLGEATQSSKIQRGKEASRLALGSCCDVRAEI